MNELKKKPFPYILIIQRWTDLVVLSIISALIFVLLYPVTTKLISKLSEWLPQSGKYFNLSIPHLILLFLVTTFLWFILIRLGGFRYYTPSRKQVFHLIRSSCFYPPTWFFAFFGAILYYWMTSLIYNAVCFDWSIIGLAIVSFIPGIIFASILDSLFSIRKHSSIQSNYTPVNEKTIKSFRALLQNPSAFINWLNKETPIQASEDDLFDLAIFSKRIAKMLQATPLKTIAIVGSYGCGKSSIINMIEEYLKINEVLSGNHIDTNDIIHCKIQGWGLQKNATAEHILQSLLSELSKSVDCLGLTSIPADYSIALSNSGSSWLKPLAVLSNTKREPLEILRKLDTVLTCTGKRMIIFLEDIDRNTTSVATWKELTSLLDRLKDLDNISFVLAINQPSMTYDMLLRVCEHVEFIPTLPQTEILECIKFFRNYCLDKFADKDIDCRTREERDAHIGLKKTSQEYDVADMLGFEVNDPITVITKLLNNPRTLKSTLRHALHSWDSLHGEIDYDDLFAARVIYTVAPEAFAFINEYRSKLMYFDAESTSQDTRKRQEENRKLLETEWQNIRKTWNSELVKTLIDFLFTGWIKDNFYKGNVPQGVIHSRPTDYWGRLNREALSVDEIPDQVILHALSSWKLNHNQTVYQGFSLPEAIFHIKDFVKKFEYFGSLLDGHDIRAIAQELFELIRKDGGKIPKDAHYYGFIELWRLSLDKPIDEHNEWLLDEIKKAIPVSLRFANELYYYWRNQDHPSTSTRIKTPILRNGFIEATRQVYENNSQALINALDPAYMYSIHHFMIYYSEADGGGSGFNPIDWKWFIDSLLKAAEVNPQVVIPQLVTLLSNEDSTIGARFIYSLNEERLNSLFGEKKSTVLKLLATNIDTSIFDERDKNRIEFVRQEAAGRILNQQNDGTSPST
ncbi:MAG: hypothetical protein JW976_07165 [Syntrophaceae bacterium]|nr:hypothetical protein [Syntrophaceae bacterium]